jgi:hypothetical protein
MGIPSIHGDLEFGKSLIAFIISSSKISSSNISLFSSEIFFKFLSRDKKFVPSFGLNSLLTLYNFL